MNVACMPGCGGSASAAPCTHRSPACERLWNRSFLTPKVSVNISHRKTSVRRPHTASMVMPGNANQESVAGRRAGTKLTPSLRFTTTMRFNYVTRFVCNTILN